MAAAVKRVESANKDRQKLDDTARGLDERQEELIANVRDLLVEANLERSPEEPREPLEELPMEPLEREPEFAEPVESAAPTSSSNYHGRRRFFFRGR